MKTAPMVEVRVARLGIDSNTNAFVVILRELAGGRILPIWIGKAEAESIVMTMNQVRAERPRTHDLCSSLVTGLGGEMKRVNITSVQSNTYFAELCFDGPNGPVEIDGRPSDGIAIALRLEAPIFAADSLLTDIEIDEDSETVDSAFGSADSVESRELSAEALKAYLERLRPEDFGKFRP